MARLLKKQTLHAAPLWEILVQEDDRCPSLGRSSAEAGVLSGKEFHFVKH